MLILLISLSLLFIFKHHRSFYFYAAIIQPFFYSLCSALHLLIYQYVQGIIKKMIFN